MRKPSSIKKATPTTFPCSFSISRATPAAVQFEQTRIEGLTSEPIALTGPWEVAFDPKWGGPARPVTFNELTDWTKRAEDGIKYYSGKATYQRRFVPPGHASQRVFLNLGQVRDLATVRLNP